MIQVFIKTLNEKTIVYRINEFKSIKQLKQQLYQDKIVNTLDFYIINNGTLLKNDSHIGINDTLYIQRRIKGGIIDVIINCLIALVKMFVKLVSLIDEIISIIVSAAEIMPKLFEPTAMIDDILYGATQGINMVMQAFLDSMDTSSVETDESENSGPFGISKESKRVCVPPTMVNIIFLILCPPLALFLQNGIKGFFQVIVCSLLTLKAYYFPGLIYAALHILC